METKKIKVLIVDDSAVVRQTMTKVLASDRQIEVIGAAGDPFMAADVMARQAPDVILLDIEMPQMDGLTFLEKIMKQHPIPVIIVSTLVEHGAASTLRALDLGAVDILQKPKLGTKLFIEESRQTICDAVHGAAKARLNVRRRPAIQKLSAAANAPGTGAAMQKTTEKVIVIGSSAGGTEALSYILGSLPYDCPGIVITQHMPEKFTTAFAQRLNDECDVTVKEAKNNDTVIRGHVLIAPGNYHMLLKRSGARYYVEVKDGPLINRHRPAVGMLFRTAAKTLGENGVGFILTGMGDDGSRELKEMLDAGAKTYAQDEKSCVVFGMPKKAIEYGSASRVVSLEQIPGIILNSE